MRVAIPTYDGVVPFDLATPCEVFGRSRLVSGAPAYDVVVCGDATVDAGAFALTPRSPLSAMEQADIVVIAGLDHLDRPLAPSLLMGLGRAVARGARVVSICTGAFVLAEAGLLRGRRATTHWLAAQELARRYPDIEVDPSVLYVDEGDVMTSAGAAAGLDLCLHMVRKDFGASVAAHTARVSVMPLERPGGQAQFIAHPVPDTPGDSLQPLLSWVVEHLTEDLTLPTLARRAGMSRRTLVRRFREQLDTTPGQWVANARVRRARELLETTSWSVERVAEEVGFGSAAAFRVRFKRQVGTTPRTYRLAVGGR